MVKEGVMRNPDIDVMIGLHINAQTTVGTVSYKPGGTMAAADRWVMKIKGKQLKRWISGGARTLS